MVIMQWIAVDVIKPSARNVRAHLKKPIRRIADSIAVGN